VTAWDPGVAAHDTPPLDERNGTKAEATRRRILAAAAKVFRARGFVGARLTDIAAEAGLQAGSLYYHFESREALVEEVMWAGQRRTEAHVRQQLEALGPEAPPLRRLHGAIEAHLLALLSSTDANSATIKMIGQVPPDIRERLLVGQRAYGDLWRSLLVDARDAGELRDDIDLSIVRMTILGALNWSVEWYHADKGNPERIAADMATVMVEGLRRR
jgi:TetR/AcrR family transcriptional regulator, cholesterol catabolism regulator